MRQSRLYPSNDEVRYKRKPKRTEEKENRKGLAGWMELLTVKRDMVVAVANDEGRIGELLEGERGLLGRYTGGSVRYETDKGNVIRINHGSYSTSKSAVTNNIGASNGGRGRIGSAA